MMEPLVTLAQAKDQLSITHDAQDAFVQSKLDEAQAIVLAYCNAPRPEPLWTAATAPAEVRSAILDVVTDLYTDRGDVERSASRTSSPWDGYPTPAVRGKLSQWHRPGVA